MSATVTEWKNVILAECERRYVPSGAIAARVTYVDGKTSGGVPRPWRMMVYCDGANGPASWWHYATLDEAIAGADAELLAIAPGLERSASSGTGAT